MKKIFITIFLLLAATSYASQNAITDTGEEVILNSDGTWIYSDIAKKPANIIEINKNKFYKPSYSSFLLKSIKNNSAFWMNTDKWSFKKIKDNTSEGEYEFKLKDADLYGLAITEEIAIPLESLADIVFENVLSVAPDSKIIKKEYRVVNGKKVIYMEYIGTIQDVKFIYVGHYYSDASGSTQLVTYTGANLLDKYKSEINDFINGLDTQ